MSLCLRVVSLPSLHTLALLEKEDLKTNWFLFGGRNLGLSLPDSTSYCCEGKLKNQKPAFFVCVCGVLLRGQSPAQGQNQKMRIPENSKVGDTWLNQDCWPGALNLSSQPHGHYLQWSCSSSLCNFPSQFLLQVAESFPFPLHPPSKLRQYSSHCCYNLQWMMSKCLYFSPLTSDSPFMVCNGSFGELWTEGRCLIVFFSPLFPSARGLQRHP